MLRESELKKRKSKASWRCRALPRPISTSLFIERLGAFLHNLLPLLRRPVLEVYWQRLPGTRDLAAFCHQFAALLGAGITVMSALQILERQIENPMLKKTVKKVGLHVEKGKSLAYAFAQEQKIFPPLFSGMVEAGETSGKLDNIMQRLALYYAKKSDFEQKVKTATAYPKFVLLVIAVVIAFLITFVVPTFAGTFAGMGVDPPLPTRFLLSLGKGLRQYWYLFITAAAACRFLFSEVLKTKKGSYYRDLLRLRMPLFGPLNHKIMVSRFCRTLSTMLGSGVGLLTALDLAKNVADNEIFIERIEQAKNDILRGEAISETLAAAGLFPVLVTGMIKVGEQAGKLEEMLARAADLYESEVNHVVERLASLLEPALIIFLSLVVGGILLCILLPIFSVFDLYL